MVKALNMLYWLKLFQVNIVAYRRNRPQTKLTDEQFFHFSGGAATGGSTGSKSSGASGGGGGAAHPAGGDAHTVVVVSFLDESVPYRFKVPAAPLTLRVFKDYLPRKGNYRYVICR